MEQKHLNIFLVILLVGIIGVSSVAVVQQMSYQSLDSQYQDLLTDYETLSSEWNQTSDDLNDLQSEFETMQTAYLTLIDDYASLSEIHLIVLSNNTDLQQSLDDLQDLYDQLLEDFALLNASFVELEQNYADLQADYAQLQSDYDDLQANYNQLLLDYDDLVAQYQVLQDSYNALVLAYATLELQYDDLLLDYNTLLADYNTLADDFSALQNDYDALELAYNTLTTWIRRQILPAQYMVFAEAVRRYYFEDFYVQDKWYEGNESGYWTEFARFCRDVILHDSSQMIEGTVLGQDSEFLIIPPEEYDPFEGVIVLENFAWYKVDGIVSGDNIQITVDFTNDDTDVMVWWADTDNSTWTYANNLVGYKMSTDSSPETGSFPATRGGSIMIGIFNYDREPGIWSARVVTQFGLFATVSNAMTDVLQYGSGTENLAWTIMTSVLGYPWSWYWGGLFLTGDQLEDIYRVVSRNMWSIDYEYDSDITRFREPYDWDYIKFPVETAFRTMGDCEDQAILCASHLESCGFETAMLIVHDEGNPEFLGGFYHGALFVKLDNMTAYWEKYPNTTVWNMAWWDDTWTEGGILIDTTWNVPFGTEPAWIQYYLDTYSLWSELTPIWTIAFCDIDGFITYVPSGPGSAALEVYAP